MFAHPDRGGNALLFNYAHALYVSNDVTALSFLYECLMKDDFSSFAKSVRQKLNAMYEIAKAKPSYLILLCDMKKDYAKADALTEKYLKSTIDSLKAKAFDKKK